MRGASRDVNVTGMSLDGGEELAIPGSCGTDIPISGVAPTPLPPRRSYWQQLPPRRHPLTLAGPGVLVVCKGHVRLGNRFPASFGYLLLLAHTRLTRLCKCSHIPMTTNRELSGASTIAGVDSPQTGQVLLAHGVRNQRVDGTWCYSTRNFGASGGSPQNAS